MVYNCDPARPKNYYLVLLIPKASPLYVLRRTCTFPLALLQSRNKTICDLFYYLQLEASGPSDQLVGLKVPLGTYF
jgi:hypothetical protein